jgi:hypothetical protein
MVVTPMGKMEFCGGGWPAGRKHRVYIRAKKLGRIGSEIKKELRFIDVHGPSIEKSSAGNDVTGGRLARRGDLSRESIYIAREAISAQGRDSRGLGQAEGCCG